jgi:membrane-bound metal-dependent hydrolase YbcI (DUF457 family)
LHRLDNEFQFTTKKEERMAQAGIHGLVSMAVRKLAPARTWLVSGIVLGSILPDADNLAVAVATVTKQSTTGLHRTFTHSIFTVLAVVIIFYLISMVVNQPRWNNLGVGLGLGILLHIVVDLVIWFDGVAILWPLPSWVNIWDGVTVPDWWTKLMNPLELLFFVMFFFSLYILARRQATDLKYTGKLRAWIGLQSVLFLVFLALAFTMKTGFLTIFGAIYLLSLGLAIGVTIRMQATIERSIKPSYQ